jgi:predicted N-formylglutamate amidohydrolase
MYGGQRRPWDAGFLSRTDMVTAEALLDCVGRARPDLIMALNEPYQIDDDGDWFIPLHAEPRGIRHCLIEVCNDQLHSEAAVEAWAGLLVQAIGEALSG